MTFKTVTGDMQGLVGEGHQDFEALASRGEKMATAASSRAASKTDEQMADIASELGTGDSLRARYKIELTFGPQRTVHGPNLCGIQLWESGKHFHGGGDELMYWCKDNREGHDEGCWAPISGTNIRDGMAFCTNCQRMVAADLLTNMKIGKVSTKNLSQELVKVFASLGSSADIFIKYHQTDVRYIAMLRAKGPQVAKRLKGMHIYPLRNILRDTMNGADLAGRFHAFLTS